MHEDIIFLRNVNEIHYNDVRIQKRTTACMHGSGLRYDTADKLNLHLFHCYNLQSLPREELTALLPVSLFLHHYVTLHLLNHVARMSYYIVSLDD